MSIYKKIFLSISILLLQAFSTQAAENKLTLNNSLEQGHKLLYANKPDSALSCFIKAYSQGLSRDSLFYYWSEVMLSKGVLDSALASNYMIRGIHTGKFKERILQQRYSIYKSLNWESDAERLLDTIRSLPFYRRSFLIPDLSLHFQTSGSRDALLRDSLSPWSSNENIFASSGGLKSSWIVSSDPKMSLGAAVSFSIQTSAASSQINLSDSADLTASLFFAASGKSLSFSSSADLRFDANDSLQLGASIEGGYLAIGRWTKACYAGGSIFLNQRLKYDNSNLWLFTSASKKISKGFTFEGSNMVSVYNDKNLQFELSKTKVYYAEDCRLQYPIFYTGSDLSQVIDTSSSYLLRGRIEISGKDTVVSIRQPPSSIGINPKTSLSISFIRPVSLGLAYKIDYYWEPYEWWNPISFNGIIYSRKEDTYYIFPAGPDWGTTRTPNGSLALDVTPQPAYHSAIRIDQSLGADISIQLVTGKFGKVHLKSGYRRTWSTLDSHALLKIPKWISWITLDWRLNMNRKKL